MKPMKYLKLLLLIPFLMSFQCDEDILLKDDELYRTDLLGRWEIADETISGITDLLPKCCKFFEFNINNNGDDLIGDFYYTDSSGTNTNGIFTVDTVNQTITFEQEGKQPVVYNYVLDATKEYLTFSFNQDNKAYVQGWAKVY
jgi:hypothetical protein